MRRILEQGLVLALLISVHAQANAAPPADTVLIRAPAVTETSQIWGDPALPGTAAAREVERSGYVREEYFLSGTANVYRSGDSGRPVVERADVPYTTRLIVIRPRNPARFSGNVQLTPFHPMLGVPAWTPIKDYVLANGDAYVGVMIGGSSNRPMGQEDPDPPVSAPLVLEWFDPQGYAKIDWPTEDGIRWDVFAQTAARLRDDDGPLAPLTVERVYASGWSFTGSFLRTFINEGFHDSARDSRGRPLIDGYLIGISASTFVGGYVALSSRQTVPDPMDPRRRNKPIDVPVIELMSENEAVTLRGPQAPDKDSGMGRHRLYQVGGLTHGAGPSAEPSVVDLQYASRGSKRPPYPGRENGDPCSYPMTDIRMSHFGQAALANLDRWVQQDEPPPRAPRLELDSSYRQIRDELGNVRGGVRPAQLDVPLARYGQAPGEACAEIGFPFLPMRRAPLTREQLAKLYPGGRAEYLERFDAAVDRLVAQRFILPSHAATQKAQARIAAAEAFPVVSAGSAQPSSPTAEAKDAGQRCAGLIRKEGAALGEPTARIVTSKLNPPTAAAVDPSAPPWAAGVPAMPEHCEVVGVMRERVGEHDQRYAVRFRVRLPTDWNGRFLFQGGGGTNGMLGTTVGLVQPGRPTALDRGFAVVSTDTGHDNATNSDPGRGGTAAFGHDYLARVEYAEKALDSVATAAKRIVEGFYDRSPRRSYFMGCSNGGREGMVFAQRFPEQFDGIVAAAPAFAVPKAAIAEAWDTQTFAALATAQGRMHKSGLPDIARTFSDADLDIVAETIANVCDADDGVADGMVQNLLQCTTDRVLPALNARICSGSKASSCLSREQITALVRSYGGPRDSKGRPLYADWPWDVGIGDPGWRMWKIGTPGAMQSINVMLGGAALSALFVTPPATVAATYDSLLRYQLAFDFDRDAPKIFAVSAEFPRSAWDLVGAQSTDLDAFRQRGGKLIVPHGGSDPIFSINDTIEWWQDVDAANGGDAASFVRVYPVPGMTHCGGGPATDRYYALAAVVDWVEDGRPPDRIEATAGPGSPWPGRTRPLCPYPTIARYRSGDVERADSFVCEQPDT